MVSNPFSDGISIQIDSDSSGFNQGISGAITRLGDFRTEIGLAGAAVGTLSAVGLKESARSFADFDEAMTESIAIMGDVSDTMEDDMAQAARDVAKVTQFSAEEAAESYFFLASAGLDAAEAIDKLPDVAEFAQAGQFDRQRRTIS